MPKRVEPVYLRGWSLCSQGGGAVPKGWSLFTQGGGAVTKWVECVQGGKGGGLMNLHICHNIVGYAFLAVVRYFEAGSC